MCSQLALNWDFCNWLLHQNFYLPLYPPLLCQFMVKNEIITATDAIHWAMSTRRIWCWYYLRNTKLQQGLGSKPLLPTASTAPSIISLPVTTRAYRLTFLIYGRHCQRTRKTKNIFPRLLSVWSRHGHIPLSRRQSAQAKIAAHKRALYHQKPDHHDLLHSA